MGPSHPKVVPLRAAAPVASVQGTLALDLQPRHDPPELVELPGRPAGDVVGIDLRVRRQVEGWVRRYAQAATEIVGGDRPVTQLLRWSSEEVYADLQRRALLVARAGGHLPGQERVQPVRPQVVGVRSCFLSRDVVEAGVHVRYGRRSRAIAARFELRSGRWQCTAFDFS
jgi:uncharacterized protein DUF6459